MSYRQSAFLIDSCAYFFRYYFAGVYNYSSESGQSSGGVYGFASFLVSVLEKYSPKYVACCFDEAFDTCFRNEIYPDYKANRLPPDEDIIFQLKACKYFAQLLGFSVFAHSRYEADDLIGSLLTQIQGDDVFSNKECDAVYVISGDKDFHQIITAPDIYLWDITKKSPLSNTDIFEKTDLYPSQWIDYQSLVGDSVDNVPGVKGVGAKTATRLLQEYHSLSGILENLDALSDLKIRNIKNIQMAIRDNVPMIALSKILVTIETDLRLVESTDNLVVKSIDFEEVTNFCRQMGFAQLSRRIEKL